MKTRRHVLKALGGAIAASGSIGVVGGQGKPEWKSRSFVFRKAAPGSSNAPGAGGGSGCKETGEWDKFTSATWPNGAEVDYNIEEAPNGDSGAVKAAFNTWNNYLGSMQFGGHNPYSSNKVYMDSLSGDALAVATVWYSGSEITQFHIRFDDGTSWGDAGATSDDCSTSGSVFDVQNVATHEVGHTIGLSHPDNADAHTMWGYASKGETLKRTLAKGDKNGANALY